MKPLFIFIGCIAFCTAFMAALLFILDTTNILVTVRKSDWVYCLGLGVVMGAFIGTQQLERA